MCAVANTGNAAPTAVRFGTIYEPVRPSLERLDIFLREQVDAFEPEIRELVAYTLANSGKRFRPLLLFYSGWRDERGLDDAFIRAAAVIEMVHLATLVHDDILDDAALRHQQTTISQRYGSTVAVLLGDAMFAHALKLAADFPTVEVCRTVSLATRRVCAGEIQQTFLRGTRDFGIDQYFRIIELKTAELFRLSCRLGGYLSGREPETLQALEQYGRHLGRAYQIYDDVADLYGDEAKIGKTLGTDLENGKFTLPLLLLFQNMDHEEQSRLIGRLREGSDPALADLRARLRENRIFSAVAERFSAELSLARSALDACEPGRNIDKLMQINDLVELQLDSLKHHS